MKAKIIITPKKAVLDPQGKTVQSALEHMGYAGIQAVHVGKYLEIELADGDKAITRAQLQEACHKFLSNPVIEDYQLDPLVRAVQMPCANLTEYAMTLNMEVGILVRGGSLPGLAQAHLTRLIEQGDFALV